MSRTRGGGSEKSGDDMLSMPPAGVSLCTPTQPPDRNPLLHRLARERRLAPAAARPQAREISQQDLKDTYSGLSQDLMGFPQQAKVLRLPLPPPLLFIAFGSHATSFRPRRQQK